MKPFLLAVSLILSSQLLANVVTEERIVYIRDTTQYTGLGEIWTANPDGSDQRLLRDDSQESLANFGLLSPDGKWLFYKSRTYLLGNRTAHLQNLVTGQEFEYRYFEFHGTQWLLDSSGLVATANVGCSTYLPVLFNLDGTVTELSNPDLGQKGHHVYGVGNETNTLFVLIEDCASSSRSYEIQKYNFISGEREFIGNIDFPGAIGNLGSETSWDGKWIYFEAWEVINESQIEYSTQRFSTDYGNQELVFDLPVTRALSPDGTEMIDVLDFENRIYDIATKSYRTIPVEGMSTDWSFLVTSAPPVFHKFLSSRTSVTVGEPFDLHWQVGDASECNGLGDWSGTKGTEGFARITANTVGTKIFQLSCTNLLNETRSQTISIEVQAGWGECAPANIFLTNQADVDALSITGCTTVTGSLRISGSNITSLEGLSKLKNVGGDLVIQSNASLTSLNGLSSLSSLGTDLWITNNPALDQCSAVSRLLDQWDDAEPGPGPGAGGVPDIGGDVDIGNNLGGCNSVEEVLATVDPSKINAGLNDAWYYPETSGQGFFITVFPDLGYVSLAWFTYDTELPRIGATANLGDPGHRWLTAVGPIEGNQVLMDIEMTSGGIFDAATEIIRTDPPGSDGTILLTFTSCWSGTVEYDIPSINKQGIVPIQRVAGDNIELCEVLNSN